MAVAGAAAMAVAGAAAIIRDMVRGDGRGCWRKERRTTSECKPMSELKKDRHYFPNRK
jgi:hypothetical protein